LAQASGYGCGTSLPQGGAPDVTYLPTALVRTGGAEIFRSTMTGRRMPSVFPRRKVMALYIVLASFTEQGIRNIKDSPKRAEAFKDMAKKCGATVKDTFWTLGQYDIVAIIEAPDDISITALGLSAGALGNVRTQTLRAFTPADIQSILGKVV
jgi:uncharacterized protein with GYD domain